MSLDNIIFSYILIGLVFGFVEVLILEKTLERKERGLKIKQGSLDSYYKLLKVMNHNKIVISIIFTCILFFPIAIINKFLNIFE